MSLVDPEKSIRLALSMVVVSNVEAFGSGVNFLIEHGLSRDGGVDVVPFPIVCSDCTGERWSWDDGNSCN